MKQFVDTPWDHHEYSHGYPSMGNRWGHSEYRIGTNIPKQKYPIYLNESRIVSKTVVKVR